MMILYGKSIHRGLSPRMRGYLKPPVLGELDGGSIPADAGLPSPSRRPAGKPEVYPRGCGATVKRAFPRRRAKGLSPRMRGYQLHTGSSHTLRGSIPADAGLPQIERTRPRGTQVYPRGCGATNRQLEDLLDVEGLSPRMRGYRYGQERDDRGVGSIPADAGLPVMLQTAAARAGVYPRGCGATCG